MIESSELTISCDGCGRIITISGCHDKQEIDQYKISDVIMPDGWVYDIGSVEHLCPNCKPKLVGASYDAGY